MKQRKALLASALSLGVAAASQAAHAVPVPPFNECPAVNASPSCSFLIQFTDSGINTYFDNSVGPYDSSDDTLIGALNSSSSTVNSITLSGAGNGGGIFAFEGDGLQTYISVDTSNFPNNYVITGYEGPNTYFSNITTKNVFADTGVVNFIGGLAPGASAYFSLESSPSSIQGGGGITPGGPPGLPEPGTLGLLGLGLSLVELMRRKGRTAG